MNMDEFSDEFEMSLKPGKIGSFLLELHPLIAEKGFVLLCHQYNSFSFDKLFLKLADKEDMVEISDEFENWPDQIIINRVTSP